MLLNMTWVVVGFVVTGLLLRWRSPLVLLTPNLLVTSLITPFSEGDMITINLIMLCWVMIIVTIASYMQARGLHLDAIEEVNANFARMTPRRIFWLSLALVAMLVVFAFWLSQAGVDQFESRRRTVEIGAWFNLANALLNFFALHAVIVLSLFRLRLSNPHVAMALATIVLLGLVGYLSNSRGLFIMPFLTIFFVRLARIRTTTGRLKLLALFLVPACVGLVMMALISAERRGDDGLGAGFQILGDQITNSETGYGLSPAKDAIVWAYSEQRQVPVVGTVLLGGFYGLIPREIWPGKPTFVSTGPIAGAFVFRGEDYVSRGAGIPISLPSEIALAFGSAWFLPGMVVTVLIIVLVVELIRPYPLAIFAAITFFSGLMAHGLPKSHVALILNLITLLVVCWATGLSAVRTDRTSQLTASARTIRQESAMRRSRA